jgi:hypothetical protein
MENEGVSVEHALEREPGTNSICFGGGALARSVQSVKKWLLFVACTYPPTQIIVVAPRVSHNLS